jgi:hypothetical protein
MGMSVCVPESVRDSISQLYLDSMNICMYVYHTQKGKYTYISDIAHSRHVVWHQWVVWLSESRFSPNTKKKIMRCLPPFFVALFPSLLLPQIPTLSL